MATHPLLPNGDPVTLPGIFPPMPAVARVLSRFDRAQLESFIAVAIDLADTLDGDPDQEDATDAEDDFSLSPDALSGADRGPGCVVGDSDRCTAKDDQIVASTGDGEAGDMDDAESAFAEWHTLSAATRRAGHFDGKSCNPWHQNVREDDEDGDPAGQYDEDCYSAPRPQVKGAGCPISDPDQGIDDQPQGTPGLDC